MQGRFGSPGEAPERTTNPIGHVRLMLSDRRGRRAFGCSGDRLSVRWLDKRPERTEAVKVRGLVALVCRARDVYLQDPAFSSPFEKWRAAFESIGLDAAIASDAITLVEWWPYFRGALPERLVSVELAVESGDVRSIHLDFRGPGLGAARRAVAP